MVCFSALIPVLLGIFTLFPWRDAGADFLHPQQPGDPLIFGVKGGIHLSIHPHAFDSRREGGPRGLIRIGYKGPDGYHLINYIAVEPVVKGRRSFSELDKSADGKKGSRFWLSNSRTGVRTDGGGPVPGVIQTGPEGSFLTFFLHVEKMSNGAKPVVEVTLFERWPNRVRFRTYAAEDSREMKQCVLTATMGNQLRCRELWLADRVVYAPALYADYTGKGFVKKNMYRLPELHRTKTGDVVAAITPDETVFPTNRLTAENPWNYSGKWLTQYWLKPAGTFGQDLMCRVNGRHVYWAWEEPIPGGTSFENFEFREDFDPGDEIWFGITEQSPGAAFGKNPADKN